VRITILAVFSFLLFATTCFAQDYGTPSVPPSATPKATKFDEFGDVSEREFGPKLEKFKYAILANRDTSACIVFYNSFNNSPFRQSRYFVRWKIDIYSRYSVHEGRTTFIEGGFLDKMRTELWLVPPGAERPPVDSSGQGPSSKFVGDRISCRPIDLEEVKIAADEIEESDEPNNEDQRKEKSWLPSMAPFGTGDFSLEFLMDHKQARAMLVIYLDENVFNLQAARKLIEGKLSDHAAKVKIDVARVRLAFGGYRKTPELELWALPIGGSDPELMPDEKVESN